MKKVLLVDDNSIALEGIKKNINWADLGTEIAQVETDGFSALETMKKTPCDLIISDIEMPGIDGISMSKQAIKINKFVKIILISAYDRFEYAKRAIRLGVFDYIEKPIDYAYLSEKIKNACDEIDKEKLSLKLLEQSRPAMIDKFYNDLFHYTRKEAIYHLSEYIDFLDLDLNYKYFCVVICKIENAKELKDEYGITQYEMMLYKLKDIIHQQFNFFNYKYIQKGFNNFKIIIAQNAFSKDDFLKDLHKATEKIISKVSSAALLVNIGIGSVEKDLWNSFLSHERALHALEYRFFFPQKNIFDSKEALGKNLSLEPFSETKADELIRLFCQKDFVTIEKWLKNYSHELINKYSSKSLIFFHIYTLLGKILKFLYELNIDTQDIEEQIKDTYTKLDTFKTGDQFFAWLREICLSVHNKLDISLNTYHDKLCNSVERYIKEEYSDNNLSLNDIAEHVNVSPTYLSALYKNNRGLSISDTIASNRIENACLFLEGSNLPLKEISDKCGYANQYYFSTSFKKHMGLSPSAYRKKRKNQNT